MMKLPLVFENMIAYETNIETNGHVFSSLSVSIFMADFSIISRELLFPVMFSYFAVVNQSISPLIAIF